MLKAFTQHPKAVGESYFEHLGSATGYAATLAVGALACLLHGLFPFAFQTSGSRRIRELHDRMVTHRTAPKAPPGGRRGGKGSPDLHPLVRRDVQLVARLDVPG